MKPLFKPPNLAGFRRSYQKQKDKNIDDQEPKISGRRITKICESIDSPHIKEIIISAEGGIGRSNINQYSNQFEKIKSVRSSMESGEKDTCLDSKNEIPEVKVQRMPSPSLASHLMKKFWHVYNSNMNI